MSRKLFDVIGSMWKNPVPIARRANRWTIVAVVLVALPALVLVAALAGTPTPVEATHFRASQITWNPAGGTTIEFNIQNAWRRNGYPCRDVASAALATKPCTGPGGLPGTGDVIAESIGGTQFFAGDGSPGISSPLGFLLYLVTSIDPTNNWIFGLALDPTSLPAIDTTVAHTYATSGDYPASIASCCRISSLVPPNAHINNPDGPYRVETVVNVSSGNRPPVSGLPPIVNCPQSALCSFIVPGSDPDGDPLRFRMSTSVEAGTGFVQPGPPSAPTAASISSSGVYTWDTSGATLGPAGSNTLYSTQVAIEDLDGAGAAKSKTAIDFFIQLVPKVGVPPVFNQPPTAPACGSSLTASVGLELSFPVSSSDPDPGQTVTLNVVGLPVGATMTPPLPVAGNPVTSIFSWTPTSSQVGTHVVVFTATDDSAQQAGQQGLCSVTVNASAKEPHVDYFALGDSVASGHGLMDDGEECRRSPQAYPYKVAEALAGRFVTVSFPPENHLACSGATATEPDELPDVNKWLDNQVDYVLDHLSAEPTLVSITIGANDLQWSSKFNFFRRMNATAIGFFKWLDKREQSIASSLRYNVSRLLDQPNIVIVLTDYHNPMNRSSIFFTKLPGKTCFDVFSVLADCYERTEFAINRLAIVVVLDTYVQLGRPARLGVATVHDDFAGHEGPRTSCGDDAPDVADTWVQYPGIAGSNAPIPAWMQEQTGQQFGDCFHPNEAGAAAYAKAVSERAAELDR